MQIHMILNLEPHARQLRGDSSKVWYSMRLVRYSLEQRLFIYNEYIRKGNLKCVILSLGDISLVFQF